MEEFVSSGRIADVILAFMALEVAVMGYFLWRRGEGMGLLGYVASSLAGGSLVLALRAALHAVGMALCRNLSFGGAPCASR